MVLMERFKLYFILCVWNIEMAAAPQPFAFNPGVPGGVAAEPIDLVKHELTAIYQRYSIRGFQPNRIEELMQACANEAFADMLLIFYPITFQALRNNHINYEQLRNIIHEIAFPPEPMNVNTLHPPARVPVADMGQVGPNPAGFQFARPAGLQLIQPRRAFHNADGAAALLNGPPQPLQLERHGGRRKHRTRRNKKQRKQRKNRGTRK
jgi:hypothetical protein